MRIVIIIILSAVHLLFGSPVHLLSCDAVTMGLTHHFFHANIFHLAVNCLSIWFVFSPKRKDNIFCLTTSYMIASLSVVAAGRPMVGFSDIIFATIGLRTPSLKSRWWRRREVILFLLVTLAMALVPQVSATTHIFSFAIGAIISGIIRKIQDIRYDFKKSTGHKA